jgi:hypothetical protein
MIYYQIYNITTNLGRYYYLPYTETKIVTTIQILWGCVRDL